MEWICKSVKAFTLWEAIIVMILTGTIVTLSYESYRGFTNMLEKDKQSMEELNHAVFLEREIFKLVQSCGFMELKGNAIYFDEDEASLEFGDSTLIKHNPLRGEVEEYKILEWEAEYLNENSEYLHSFWMHIHLGFHSYQMFFVKQYSKTSLLELNIL